jgi:hypothetical protein
VAGHRGHRVVGPGPADHRGSDPHRARRPRAHRAAGVPRRRAGRRRAGRMLGARARLPHPGRACPRASPGWAAGQGLSARTRLPRRPPRRFGLLVELDGRLFHDTAAARDSDLDRTLDAAVAGRLTVRLGWGQVSDRGCLTASRIGALLRRRGWSGEPTRCPTCTARWIAARMTVMHRTNHRNTPRSRRGVSQRVAHPSSSPAHRRLLGSRQQQPMEYSVEGLGWSGQDSTGTRSFWPA